MVPPRALTSQSFWRLLTLGMRGVGIFVKSIFLKNRTMELVYKKIASAHYPRLLPCYSHFQFS